MNTKPDFPYHITLHHMYPDTSYSWWYAEGKRHGVSSGDPLDAIETLLRREGVQHNYELIRKAV